MDNADLEKLKVTPGRLVPKFKASTTAYTVTVASAVTEVKLSPLTRDAGASCTVKGADGSRAVKLTEGKAHEVEVIVTAEDGTTTKTYTISIRRLSADDATLSQLDLSAGALQPAFSPLVTSYECYLPCGIESLTLKAKTEDTAMKMAMKDGTPVDSVQLNAGRTLIEIEVKSVSGTSSSVYSIAVLKSRLPCTLRLKSGTPEFECAICCCVVHLPTRIKGGSNVFCHSCLEELTRTNKSDPFTGKRLPEEDWMENELELDTKLAKEVATCPLPTAVIEASMQQVGAKLLAERTKASQIEEATQACPDCSKKVPADDMPLHKKLLCSAHHNFSLKKHDVKARPWQKRLVDDSLGSNIPALLKAASEWETKYRQALPKPGETAHYFEGEAPLDYLHKAAQCYATALQASPRDMQAHIGLGLVMEEFFYASDFYGLIKENYEEQTEGEAEQSSKEEEFLAICKLHGVPASAPAVLQLKAVEAEYHSLKEAGQTHKAEHVQQLHGWKSKKVLQASQGSYAVDTESPLYRAKLKFQDAVSTNPTDALACYNYGRLSLLLGDREVAQEHLKASLAVKPTLSPTRLCLGLLLTDDNATFSKPLLSHGLSTYLAHLQELHETQAEPQHSAVKEMHSRSFYRSTNTLLVDAFLMLAKLGGHTHLSPAHCLLSVTCAVPLAHLQHRESTYNKLLASSLKARFSLLALLRQTKDAGVLRHCRQLSALLASTAPSNNSELRELQLEVFELGVILQPSSSEALYRLGNGQLTEYEATNDKKYLASAELSFRASLAMEGKAITSDNVPKQLQEQDFYKKHIAGSQSTDSASKPTAPPTATKQATPVAKQQPIKGKPGTQAKAPIPSSSRQPVKSTAAPPTRKPAGARQPAAATSKPGGPVKPVQRGGQSKPAAAPGSKGIATLGSLKSGGKNGSNATAKPGASTSTTAVKPTASKTEEPKQKQEQVKAPDSSPAATGKVEINQRTYHPRLGLARALVKDGDAKKQEEAHKLYREVMSLAPEVHDAYIELGEALGKSDPKGAVEVYSKFPFSNPPTFDDAFLHGEIVRLLMKSESYDNPSLCSSMVAMGKALGIGVLEKQVSILENKFKSALLKKIYAGVHGKPVDDPELQAFFKFKCWL